MDTERVFVENTETSRTQEIVGKRLQEELGSSDRTEKPVKSEDNRVMHVHAGTGKPVESSANTHTMKKLTSTSQVCQCDGGTITWHHRSQIDSENREPTSTTSTSK